MEISSASVQAVAEVIAGAVANNKYCAAGVDAGASVCECAKSFKKCWHKGEDDVHACCDKDMVCGKFGKDGICQPKHLVPNHKILDPTC